MKQLKIEQGLKNIIQHNMSVGVGLVLWQRNILLLSTLLPKIYTHR